MSPLAERAGVLAAIAAVLVLVGELAGAVAWQDRIAAPASDRILTLEATDVVLDHAQMAAIARREVDDARLRAMVDNLANAQADVQRALDDELILHARAGH